MTAADRAKAAEVTARCGFHDRELDAAIAAAIAAARADAAADRDRAWRTAVDALAEELVQNCIGVPEAGSYEQGRFHATFDAAARLRGLDPTSSEEEL